MATALKRRSFLEQAAYFFSTIGNPLFTSAVILSAACLRLLNPPRAIAVGSALIVLILVPIALWTRSRVRSGQYSDYDVSRREDRTTMYSMILGLTLLAAGILYATRQPASLWAGILAASLMTAAAAFTNLRVKISLHAAFSLFYAVAIARLSTVWVAPLTVFAMLVAGSRFILKRHTLNEVIPGTALGMAAGLVLLLALSAMDSHSLAQAP